MKPVLLFLPAVVVILVAGCSSPAGKVRNGVYTAPDESFQLRLPDGARAGTVSDEIRHSGSLVGFEDGGGRSWRVERFPKNGHHISRSDPDLPLVTRLLFAESAWAESSGQVARSPLERKAVTMNDDRQAVLTVRRAGESSRSGIRGMLFFETSGHVNVLGVLDRDLGDHDVVAMRGALVDLYKGLSFDQD